jgi:hypothetical protein
VAHVFADLTRSRGERERARTRSTCRPPRTTPIRDRRNKRGEREHRADDHRHAGASGHVRDHDAAAGLSRYRPDQLTLLRDFLTGGGRMYEQRTMRLESAKKRPARAR